MAFHRNYARYGAGTTFFDSLEEFSSAPLAPEVSAIRYGEGLLEILVENNHAPTTIVMFHAAIDPAQTSLPVFIGRNLTSETEANVIFVSDPSLELGAPIGWFSGDRVRNLQTDLLAVLRHALSELDTKQTVLFGMSAGGFAALYYSMQFDNSLAIVCNPQTNILKYHPAGVSKYIERCWGDEKTLRNSITWDLVDTYGKAIRNYVLYLQNDDDVFHKENHLEPWRSAVPESQNRFKVHIDNWGEGHAPMPAVFLQAILNAATQCDGAWDELFLDDFFEG